MLRHLVILGGLATGLAPLTEAQGQSADAQAAARQTVTRIVDAVTAALPGEDAPFRLLVRLRAKPGMTADVLASYRTQAEQAERNDGNLAYHVSQDAMEPDIIHLYEDWRDLGAFVTHETSDETLAHFERVGPRLEEERSLQIVVPAFP